MRYLAVGLMVFGVISFVARLASDGRASRAWLASSWISMLAAIAIVGSLMLA